MKDINDKEDVKVFVNAFYEKVQKDELLGPIFASRIKEGEWAVHLERMYSFWNTVLFGQIDYRGNPFSKHTKLPVFATHFQRWINLLSVTVDDYFEGEKADEVKLRAERMGNMFQTKLKYIRDNDQFINLV